MINKNTAGNRLVEIRNGVIQPVEPRKVNINQRKPEDYLQLAKAYLEVAEMYGPKFGGPPLCDEFVALLLHMFTEEEASAVRHLKGAKSGKAAQEIAEIEHRSTEEIARIMDGLADEKRIILAFGSGEKRRYFLQPLLPGAWETILVRTSMDTLTDWHIKFTELFLPLYDTGFTTLYLGQRPPGIRYLPVGQSIERNSYALPSDKFGEVFDQYKDFAVGLCQCRMGAEIIGQSCGRPKENCITMGPIAVREAAVGAMRKISFKDAMDIKAEAEASGLVSWTMAMEIGGSNTSCSCCGCCCMMMRTISEFNAPGYIAPPHFLPVVDDSKCSFCGKCAKACPMGAWTVDTKNKARSFETMRCIGCGLCYAACDKDKAVELKPAQGYQTPTMKKVERASHPLASISGVEKG
ncbi:MAG: 4Fe-4S dicluster domain-containing protein [Proteobacteria bacterium]|nr:4Fe-4S dicluster domain-containing protein [Pseudomonadota bacterium]